MSYTPRYMNAPRAFSSASMSGPPNRRTPQSSTGSLLGASTGPGSRKASMPTKQGMPSRPDDKETMKGLNERLAGYLQRVGDLEESNTRLEEQIRDILASRGSNDRDWEQYERPLADLRKQVRDMTMDNARLLLQIDNARLAADDFKVKYESELSLRQSVENDLVGLRKILDDTNITRMQLEGQIESLKEERAYLKKNHQEEAAALRAQISDSGVVVEMDAGNAPDLSNIVANIRSQYEKEAQKNHDDIEAWYKNKFDNVTAEVTHNTEALQLGKSELSDLRRQIQMLEIEVHTIRNMNQTLENTLKDTEASTGHDMEKLNQRILRLQDELTRLRAQIEQQAADYQALLSTKTKLESEIAQYRKLLEGLIPD